MKPLAGILAFALPVIAAATPYRVEGKAPRRSQRLSGMRGGNGAGNDLPLHPVERGDVPNSKRQSGPAPSTAEGRDAGGNALHRCEDQTGSLALDGMRSGSFGSLRWLRRSDRHLRSRTVTVRITDESLPRLFAISRSVALRVVLARRLPDGRR